MKIDITPEEIVTALNGVAAMEKQLDKSFEEYKTEHTPSAMRSKENIWRQKANCRSLQSKLRWAGEFLRQGGC